MDAKMLSHKSFILIHNMHNGDVILIRENGYLWHSDYETFIEKEVIFYDDDDGAIISPIMEFKNYEQETVHIINTLRGLEGKTIKEMQQVLAL